MKRGLIFLFLCIAVSTFLFAAEPVEGFWFSMDDKTGKPSGGWELYIIGDTLYGKTLSIANEPQDKIASKCKESYKGFPLPGKVNEMRVVGTPWIFGLTRDNKQPDSWSGGNILDAGTGHLYKCKVIYRPRDGKKYMTDVLEMRGEIGLGIGKSLYWQKCTREEAASLR